MKRLFLILQSSLLVILLVMLLASCTETYRIDGSCAIEQLDGKQVFLKVYQGGDMVSIDSCRIREGRFTLHGNRDSMEMANIFVGEQSVSPIVLDGTELYVKIGEGGQKIGGSVMNDSLYRFIQDKNRIDSMMAELPRNESRMIMDGMDYDEIQAILNQNAAVLHEMDDHLVTSFIKANASNVMGPGVFMIVTSSFPYPALTPQIEEILTVVPAKFKAHPYVKDFVEMAEENMLRIREGEQPLR